MEKLVKKIDHEDQSENKTNEDAAALHIANKQNTINLFLMKENRLKIYLKKLCSSTLYLPQIQHENGVFDEPPDIERAVSNESNNQDEEDRAKTVTVERKCTKKRIAISTAFLLLASTLLVIGYIFEGKINSQIDIISDWVRVNQVAAHFIIVSIYIIGIVVWIPGAIFLIFGSFIWGRVYGQIIGAIIFTFIDFFCNYVGQALAFLNSRYLFKSCVQRWISKKPRLLALSLALSNNTKKLVALGRVSCITPYFVFNNICGITEMKFVDYLFGNIFTIICHTPFVFIFAGITDVSKLSNDPTSMGTGGYIILFVSIAISIIIVIFVLIYARKEFRKHMTGIEPGQSKTLMN